MLKNLLGRVEKLVVAGKGEQKVSLKLLMAVNNLYGFAVILHHS